MSSALEQRLRRALSDTHETPPRPISPIELPLKLDRLLTPELLRSLRPAAVLAPVIRRGAELTVLFTRRSEHLRKHGGQISFPGGRREDSDESAAHAALREAQEEIGLASGAVEVIGYLDDYPTVTRYLITPVVGLVESPPAFAPDAGEVAEVFEVPLDYLLRAESFQRKRFSRNGLNVPFFEVAYEGRVIWGATAGMLWNLAQKVQAAP
ncbi:MAG: CoA pyrophosphatase [Gammaproteobacteria bacterium]|nr:CoA pyrophosphatase [Gammaproteobacteria bacterium]